MLLIMTKAGDEGDDDVMVCLQEDSINSILEKL